MFRKSIFSLIAAILVATVFTPAPARTYGECYPVQFFEDKVGDTTIIEIRGAWWLSVQADPRWDMAEFDVVNLIVYLHFWNGEAGTIYLYQDSYPGSPLCTSHTWPAEISMRVRWGQIVDEVINSEWSGLADPETRIGVVTSHPNGISSYKAYNWFDDWTTQSVPLMLNGLEYFYHGDPRSFAGTMWYPANCLPGPSIEINRRTFVTNFKVTNTTGQSLYVVNEANQSILVLGPGEIFAQSAGLKGSYRLDTSSGTCVSGWWDWDKFLNHNYLPIINN